MSSYAYSIEMPGGLTLTVDALKNLRLQMQFLGVPPFVFMKDYRAT
jgi:hypothetical protein